MSSRKWLWSALLLFVFAGPALAQTAPPQLPSPLELVRGLRAAGMPDLALEYLRQSENKPMPEDDRKSIPLKHARCLLEVAEAEADEGTRTNMVGEAKEAFNDFIVNNPNHPRLAEASLSLARLTSIEAKAQLTRPRRMELPPRDDPGYESALAKKRQEGLKAQPLFLVASKNFDAAAKQINTRLEDKTLDPQTRKVLEQEATDAALAAALNQYYLAETFIEPDAVQTQQRGKFLEDARGKFARLANSPNTRTYWIAQAWKAEVLIGLSNGAEADTIFKDILASNLPEAEEGKRMVRFFQIRRLYESAVTDKNAVRLQAVEKDVRAWLTKYHNRRKTTPEAISMEYYLAVVLQRQAELSIGPPPKDPSRPVTIGANAPGNWRRPKSCIGH